MSLKFNIFPQFGNQKEAEYFISGSGLDRWMWEHETYADVDIDDMLVDFLYKKADGVTTLDDLLSNFIKKELRLNPREFAMLDSDEIMDDEA